MYSLILKGFSYATGKKLSILKVEAEINQAVERIVSVKTHGVSNEEFGLNVKMRNPKVLNITAVLFK